LIKCASKKGCKGGQERYGSATTTSTDADAHQVLLGNKAFNVAVVEGFLVRLSKSGILGVAIKTYY